MNVENSRTGSGANQALFDLLAEGDVPRQALMEQAARIADLGYFVFNVDTDRVEICSDRHAAMFGLTPEQFMERASGLKGDLPMMHPNDAPAVRAEYEHLKKGRRIEMEYRFFRSDGATGCIREFVNPIFDERGHVVRGFGSSLDVTEERLRSMQLSQASRMVAVGELTAGVAHDFNNTLAVILGNVELIRDLRREVDVTDLIDEIVAAVHRGSGLTRNLLSFAQRAPVAPRLADLNEDASNALKLFQRASLRKFQIHYQFTTEPLRADVDHDLLQSAMLNILMNAADASEVAGEISIATRALCVGPSSSLAIGHDLTEGRYGVVEVRDSGRGIPPEILPRVTEPFFTTKGRAQGSGLGLSMASGFARQSGGTLLVQSSEGEGTIVRIVLPLAKDAADTPHGDEAADACRCSGNVLLVEAAQAGARALTAQVTSLGFTVARAASLDEAVRLAAETPFDHAILGEVSCGDASVCELVIALKAVQPKLNVLRLACLTETDGAAKTRPQVDGVLIQPVTLADLHQALCDV
ncbi:MAG: ATP-binding protein [Pseudomonadota bacterium]